MFSILYAIIPIGAAVCAHLWWKVSKLMLENDELKQRVANTDKISDIQQKVIDVQASCSNPDIDAAVKRMREGTWDSDKNTTS